MSTSNKQLLAFTIIEGKIEEGTLSNAIHITRHLVHKTAFLDMKDPGMEDAEIPGYMLHKDLKAIIIQGVLFPEHTQRIKKIISQNYLSFLEPGNPVEQKIKMPSIIICTETQLEKIPLEIFPEKPGYLKCG